MNNIDHSVWPELPYEKFKSTAHLLHMGMQMIGKLKLYTPFEPHWANVALWLTSNGLTTGPINYKHGVFSIDIDFISHNINCATSWGRHGQLALSSQSVADFYINLFKLLKSMEIDLKINPMPQEMISPIAFHEDTIIREYNNQLAHDWWQILLNSYRVMQEYHSRFIGETPPIGLMWGTFDLRDARYNGIASETSGINAGYIRRNAMNEEQIEIGWWHGNEAYPHPAYYSYTYPQPKLLENAKIQPTAAHWDNTLQEFILDYDALRHANEPEKDLMAFFETTYQAGANSAHWKPDFITTGKPV